MYRNWTYSFSLKSLASESPKWYSDALTTLWRQHTKRTLTTYMAHYTHSRVYNNPLSPDAHTHTHTHVHTQTQTHKAWLQWCDGKCQARGCKHLNLISYSLCSHLGLGGEKERWFILHDKYEFLCDAHLEKWRKKKKKAQALFKRYRFSAQLLSFCSVSGSEVAHSQQSETKCKGGEKIKTVLSVRCVWARMSVL